MPSTGEDKEVDPQQEFGLKQEVIGFLGHLDELRKRLIRIIIFLVVGTIICLIFSKQLLSVLTSTFTTPGEGARLALLQPTEGFIVHLKVSFVAGLFLSSPLWLTQLWAFIGPGLYASEKKVIIPVIAASVVAFLTGVTFGWWVLPHAVNYFRSFAGEAVAVSWSLGKYVDFSLRILVAFGVVFELPLVIYAAARLGLVTTRTLRKYRAYAILLILIASGLITPPDILTQVALAIPLLILYEVGIILAAVALRRKRGKDN